MLKNILLIIVSIFLFAVPAFSESKIIINEFLIDPQPQQIELLNMGSDPMDIGGWIIDDNGGSSGTFVIPNGTVIYPNSCVVFSKDFNFNKTSSDAARLIDAGGSIADSYQYRSSAGPGISYQKIPDGELSWSTASATIGNFNSSQSSCRYEPTLTPTPEAAVAITATATPTVTPTPAIITNVYINEVMANPSPGNDEWIEFYNDNDFSVTLADWYIDDREDAGSSPKKFSLVLPSKSYRTMSLGNSLFNNDGDSVRLLDYGKSLKDSFDYSDSVPGKTYGRFDLGDGDFCIQNESPDKENNPCIENSPSPSATEPTVSPAITAYTIKPSPDTTPLKYKSQIISGSPHIQEAVLGTSDSLAKNYRREIRYFSVLSIFYSLLTAASVLFKMTCIYGKGLKFLSASFYSP